MDSFLKAFVKVLWIFTAQLYRRATLHLKRIHNIVNLIFFKILDQLQFWRGIRGCCLVLSTSFSSLGRECQCSIVGINSFTTLLFTNLFCNMYSVRGHLLNVILTAISGMNEPIDVTNRLRNNVAQSWCIALYN